MANPFIVAELSANHGGSLETALKTVEAAAKSGADAVKIQTFTPDCMTLPNLPPIAGGTWGGRRLYDLYAEAMTPYEWHKPIFDRCTDLGIVGFSTVFDTSGIEFLESLDCPMYKIASFEIGDLALIRAAAATGKPIIISTGMASWNEILDAAIEAGKTGTVPSLLKCVSAYPAPAAEYNLATIRDLSRRWVGKIGLSDHTLGHACAAAATALGAEIIEKHFTLSRASGGPDSSFSSEPDEFRAMVDCCREVAMAIGVIHYGPTRSEQSSIQFKRSLWAAKAIRRGQPIPGDAIVALRPNDGLPCSKLSQIVGMVSPLDIKAGSPLPIDLIA